MKDGFGQLATAVLYMHIMEMLFTAVELVQAYQRMKNRLSKPENGWMPWSAGNVLTWCCHWLLNLTITKDS